MPSPPANSKIYHITHVENLPQILTDRRLLSDAIVNQRGGPNATIGMSTIKARRLSLPVKCHQGDKVGDYVPFYFCPRSVMLYIIHQGNHPEVAYRGGQGPILHLEADLNATLAWALQQGKRWAFTLSNAGAVYTQFRSNAAQLNEIDWDAVAARDWRAPEVREGKQAEFLMYQEFPWHLVERIGVLSASAHSQVRSIIGGKAQPVVEIKQDWYY
jgi:ssDNA thymidine ADP-ribosyltransferase DarT-like protein